MPNGFGTCQLSCFAACLGGPVRGAGMGDHARAIAPPRRTLTSRGAPAECPGRRCGHLVFESPTARFGQVCPDSRPRWGATFSLSPFRQRVVRAPLIPVAASAIVTMSAERASIVNIAFMSRPPFLTRFFQTSVGKTVVRRDTVMQARISSPEGSARSSLAAPRNDYA